MARPKYHSVEHFTAEQSETIGTVCEVLNTLFLDYPNVSVKIRFNIPFYDYGTWICYINPLKKKDAIELVFLQGKELQRVFPFLEDKGRKMVAGIEIHEITDTIMEQVIMVWEEAISSV